MEGRRVLSIDEIPKDFRIHSNTIKRFTGNKRLPYRGIYDKRTEIPNYATGHVFANNDLKFDNADEALLGRIVLMESDSTFVDKNNPLHIDRFGPPSKKNSYYILYIIYYILYIIAYIYILYIIYNQIFIPLIKIIVKMHIYLHYVWHIFMI